MSNPFNQPKVTIEFSGLDELKNALEEVQERMDSLQDAVMHAECIRLSIQTKINQPSAETELDRD